jgi:hypothetical protein
MQRYDKPGKPVLCKLRLQWQKQSAEPVKLIIGQQYRLGGSNGNQRLRWRINPRGAQVGSAPPGGVLSAADLSRFPLLALGRGNSKYTCNDLGDDGQLTSGASRGPPVT